MSGLKEAAAFLDELILEINPPPQTAFALVERKPAPGFDFNWILSRGPLSDEAERKIAAKSKLHPRLSFEGVHEYEGDYRAVTRWISG
ncbi:MAG TPA: hypothetical protein VMT72_16225 [Pseudolabrys sp.]|nr:hypothetical protein [Pseudolabrys sp.]